MIAPRYRKALRDLLEHKGRSLLAVLAMAAGMFQVAVMLTSYALSRPELMNMYGRTNPASATLSLDAANDSLVAAVRAVPGVTAAEARPVIVARVAADGDDWVPAMLHVVTDFDHQQLDLFKHDSGSWPPGPGDVVFERTAMQVAGVKLGDSVTVRLPGGRDVRVRVAGTAHAAGMPPAWMEHMVPAFVGRDSWLRSTADDSQLRIVTDHPLHEGAIRETADSVRAVAERAGHPVTRVTVPPPGRHPHAAQMEAFLFLLLTFGLLSFALSTILLVSMVHALMAEQVRQVGIMKTLGATSVQVAGIYLTQVGLLALAALAIGLPLGTFVGKAYAQFSAGILNTDVSASPFPWWALCAEVALGLLLPMLVGMGPVQRAARITVREALSDEVPPLTRLQALDRWLVRVAAHSRPLALTLRGTLARRSRLVLTVLLLGVGGAVFMAAMNVAEAWKRGVEDDFSRRRYDLMVGFSDAVPIAEVEALLAEVPTATQHECWPSASPWIIGVAGVPTVTTAFVAPDPGSAMAAPRLSAGHWLDAADSTGVVVNQAVAERAGGLAVGDSVRLRLRGRTWAFPVVGLARELVPMPVIYAPRAAVLAVSGRSPDSTRSVRIVLGEHSDAAQRAGAQAVERAAESRGLMISGIQRMQDAKKGILDHLVIILSVLTLATLVVLFVGVLALATTLALSVVQRTREFGIMSAIGATPAMLARQVWTEALVLGGLSGIAAIVITIPVSIALESACGLIFFKLALDPWISPTASLLWLGIVFLLASVCSLAPALHVSRLTVREALSRA